jgi:hypothetical protein
LQNLRKFEKLFGENLNFRPTFNHFCAHYLLSIYSANEFSLCVHPHYAFNWINLQ